MSFLLNEHSSQIERLETLRRAAEERVLELEKEVTNAKMEVKFLTEENEEVDTIKAQVKDLEERLAKAVAS